MLRGPSGFHYEPTPNDVLWLMRAVAGEGPDELEVAQTLVNGFVWAVERARWEKSLADWVQAYAQPVNPRWLATGDLYKDRLAKATTDAERKTLANAAERRIKHRERVVFSPSVRDAVTKALSQPPKWRSATDYAAPFVEREQPWLAVTDAVQGRNRLWTRPNARGWPGYSVDGFVGVLPLAVIAGVLAILVVLRS